MDSPISWFILVILAIYFSAWIWRKGEEELARYKSENSSLFDKD